MFLLVDGGMVLRLLILVCQFILSYFLPLRRKAERVLEYMGKRDIRFSSNWETPVTPAQYCSILNTAFSIAWKFCLDIDSRKISVGLFPLPLPFPFPPPLLLLLLLPVSLVPADAK